MNTKDRKDLGRAKRILEHPRLMIRLLNIVGVPLEKAVDTLPKTVSGRINTLVRGALMKCMEIAIATLDNRKQFHPPKSKMHKRMVVVSGGVGGFWGLPGLAMELPLSTTVMFRSIADIARSFGEDLSQPETVLNCVQVFALGGVTQKDDAAESSYFAVRAALAKATNEAARYLATQQATNLTAPALVRFTQGVASRFSVTVSEKVAVMGVPLVGAIGGAAINAVFMQHYQEAAWAHFLVRSLERKYGPEAIRHAWDEEGREVHYIATPPKPPALPAPGEK
ncbi:MAG: hypothetical protein AMXMBFR84_40920 [Candidatus Hydrogenedentota bacterium]